MYLAEASLSYPETGLEKHLLRWGEVSKNPKHLYPEPHPCRHSEITPLSLTHQRNEILEGESCLTLRQQNNCASRWPSLQERRCLDGHPEQGSLDGKQTVSYCWVPASQCPFSYCFLLGKIKIIKKKQKNKKNQTL